MKKLNKFTKKYFGNKYVFGVFLALFVVFLITRIIFPETKSPFGYDQVDNAWAAKNIIVEGNLPLTGMQAKGNTGFFIGPYYYYFLVPFYAITGLNPIASNFAALFVAVLSFLVIYLVVKEIFNKQVALIALFITTFSSYILELDRVQWPVNFIVPVSFLVILSLYKICEGRPKYFYLLASSFGFAMHIHFTSVFYILFVLILVPFFPRNKKTLKHALFSLPILLVFFWPIILNLVASNNGGNAVNYLESSYHGFHLRRFIQIAGDGFIEFNAILSIPYSLYVSITLYFLYLFLLFKSKIKRKKAIIAISLTWVLVPWILLSTYSGELTNYYFSIARPIVLLTFAYTIYRLIKVKKAIFYFILIPIAIWYAYVNLNEFFNTGPVGLKIHWEKVMEKIERGEKIEFVQGDPQSYLHYYYQLKNKN